MRTTCSTIALLVLTLPAFAVDIDADSLVSAATVYPQGATVTRTVEFSSPAGSNRIIIDDLPLDFDAASLRVSGAGDTAFSIVSVDHRIDRLPPVAENNNPVRKRIESEIEVLEDQLYQFELEKRQFAIDIEVADRSTRMIEMLMNRESEKMVEDVEYSRASPEVWAQTITVLAEQSKIALASRNAARTGIENVEDRAADVNEELQIKLAELNATQQPSPPRSIATVEMASNTAVSGVLEVSYRVWSAGWQPVYDLRLDQGDEANLQVERHARVSQNTGEDWASVALTLSTARPTQRMDTPDLPPSQAILFNPQLRQRQLGSQLEKAPVPIAPTAEMDVSPSRSQLLFAEEVASEPVVAAGGITAAIETQGQTIVYTLPGAASVSGDGTVRQLGIDKAEIGAELLARATPEFDTNAYLYAAMTNTFGGPILPGNASVFRDGTFVGETQLPMIAVGKQTTLPFGVLDGVEIKRHILEKEDGDYGIIGTTNRRIEKFEIEVESVLAYDIPLTIYDRVPFSEDEDLEISTYARPQVSEENFSGKRGVNAWTFNLASGGSQKIEFGFDIRWPGDQQMVVQ